MPTTAGSPEWDEGVLVDESSTLIPRAEPAKPSALEDTLATVISLGTMALNGGMVGALGPQLEAFERATGLSEADMGRAVFQNRTCKLFGSIAWGVYAQRLQRHYAWRGNAGDPLIYRPNMVVAGFTVIAAFCNAAIATWTNSSFVFQVALAIAGFVYGLTDNAVTMLTLWRWAHNARRQRIDVAMLNAAFTIGALLTPMLVAVTMHDPAHNRWTFGTLAVVALLQTVMLALMPGPRVPRLASEPHASPPPPVPRQAVGGLRDSAKLGYGWRVIGRRERMLVAALCTTVTCVTGCEHAVATWLAPIGVEQGHIDEERMALMNSGYWGVMFAGRMLWVVLSGLVTSGWPILFFDVGTLIFAAVLFLWFPHAGPVSEVLLWAGTLSIGLGVASAFPCAMTISPELSLRIPLVTLLNMAGGLGETAFPFVVGVCFENKLYSSLGILLLGSQALTLNVLVPAWILNRVQLKDRPRHDT